MLFPRTNAATSSTQPPKLPHDVDVAKSDMAPETRVMTPVNTLEAVEIDEIATDDYYSLSCSPLHIN